MIDIAKQGEAGALVTMRQAAQRQGLSVKYLEQLGGSLVRAGVLKSIRGVSGGYYLAKPADQIRATEGSCMPVACVDDEGKCDLAGCCEARGFWRGMGNAINAYIDRITLADVLEGNVEA